MICTRSSKNDKFFLNKGCYKNEEAIGSWNISFIYWS